MGIITISREFGSGGRELGVELAKNLGYKFYDKQIIALVAKEGGKTENYVDGTLSKLSDLSLTGRSSFNFYSTEQKNLTDVLITERKIISELAQKGNCVIVGRGADVILKNENPINIFVYSNMQTKIERCKNNPVDHETLTEKEIEKKIKMVDKERRKFYLMLGRDGWGEKENYDLCINSTNANIAKLATGLAELVKSYLK